MKNNIYAGEIAEAGGLICADVTHVLIVDSDANRAKLCWRGLKANSGLNQVVAAVSSVDEAMPICRKSQVDCIVLNCQIIADDGIKAIDKLRSDLGVTLPPVILYTSDDEESSVHRAITLGACDVVLGLDDTRSTLSRAVGNAVEKSLLERSLTIRVAELERANSSLIKRNKEIQRFYHTVSHEVKTPLTAIREFVSIVHDGLAGEMQEEQRTILNYALESCDQITSQFNDLLELSCFETGKMSVELSPQSISHVFDHCIVAATPNAVAKGISLNVDCHSDLPPALMDTNRIIQVLSNLICNAIKFTGVGGKVVVRCELEECAGKIRLSVRDNGCGIMKSDVERVFERLYQVTPASNVKGDTGMGLGLSIASEIVELHGSSIGVESEPGVGSEFYFELNTQVNSSAYAKAA
ncbi:MAG: ATP-binding protein [Granulosicoccus sp.]